MLESWKRRARALKQELYALYLASRDPRVPWYVRVLALLVVGYALSPIDLIPDPIPILGYLDDLVLVPLGIALVLRLMPRDVLAEHREIARASTGFGKPKGWLAASVIILIWILVAFVAVRWMLAIAR